MKKGKMTLCIFAMWFAICFLGNVRIWENGGWTLIALWKLTSDSLRFGLCMVPVTYFIGFLAAGG